MPVDLSDHPAGSTPASFLRALDVLIREINGVLVVRTLGVALSAVAGLGLVLAPGATHATTRTVTSLADTPLDGCDSNCTLREAVVSSQIGDQVDFMPGLAGTIILSRGAISVLWSMTINGPGAGVITLDANSDPSDAQGESRTFIVLGSAPLVTITGLTLQNGFNATNGGAIYAGGEDTHLILDGVVVQNSQTDGDGGGIYSVGKLTLINSTLHGNVAGSGGGFYAQDATLTRSTISDNAALDAGGFFLIGVATLTQSTVSGNSTSSVGGGFWAQGDVTLTNCTVSDNSAENEGGGIGMYGDAIVINSTISNNSANVGGGLHLVGDAVTTNNGTLILRNSVVADNAAATPSQWNEFKANVATVSYSLIEGGSLPNLPVGTNGNLIGVDPKLGPLQDNGGPTLTRALLSSSPAIDVGQNSTCATTDQRGVTRPADGDGNGSKICDLGAVEKVIDAVFSNGFEST